MDVSIITVNWNGKDKILEQIRSVRNAAEGVEYEQIISDNGSDDGSPEEIEKEFPEVKMIRNNANLGFAAANNKGVKISKGKYLLFLNPDMRMLPGTLKKIIDWMENRPDAGIVSCKLVDENGNFNNEAKPRRFPRVCDQAALILKLPHLFPGILNNYLYKDFDAEKEQEVDTVRGSFMLMRREVVSKLGWAFDPRYFIWFEDVDICRETKKLGLKVFYTPVISCVDYVGQSFKKRPSGLKQRWFSKSMKEYFRKWEPWYKWMIIYLLAPVGVLLVDIKNSWYEKKYL